MSVLIEGLGLLLKDNDDAKRSFDEQVALWKNKSATEVNQELGVLKNAKSLWLVISVMVWQVIALSTLAMIVNHIWQHDYIITFGRLLTVVVSWVTILLVVWMVANVFDRYAGFERWFKAFALREEVGPASVERLTALLDMAQQYPEILEYKNHVMARRPLRSEDLRLMEEMGRRRRSAELVHKLETL